MLELPIEVTPDGGDPVRVVATSRDIRQWEKVNKEFSFTNMASVRMTDFYGIAWKACVRQGVFTGALADFESTHDLDILNDEEEETDPTPPAR